MQDNSPAGQIRSSDQLRLLIEVSEAIATHRDLTTLLRDLARRLPAIVPFEFIVLCLHDAAKNVMRVEMLGTADADSIPPGLELPIAQSNSGLVFTTQQPLIVRSPEDTARFSIAHSLMQTTGVESFCMLPLTTIVRPLGAMGFGTSTRRAFDESELEFLQLVVNQLRLPWTMRCTRQAPRKRSGT
jgi:formate hydrogenlyase transcriptional activator